jgi:hypothetical protein
MQDEAHSQIWLNRLYAETELDLSAFTFRESDEGFLAENSLNGITFRLISLRETEDAVLAGRLWMKNEDASPKRLTPIICGEDSERTFFINDLYLRNCLSGPLLIDLVPGGECAFDFEVHSSPDGTLTIADDLPESPQDKLVQVIACGYPFYVTDQIGPVKEFETEPAYAYFHLSRPIFLKNKHPLAYSMDFSLKPANASLSEEKPTPSPEPLPVTSEKETGDPSESAADPYPFFSETVSMPVFPEQYAVTLVCPISPDERDTVTTASVLLVFPRAFSEGIYDLQARVYNSPRLDGNAVAMDFCGLLPSLEYAKQYFPCVLEEEGNSVSIDLLEDILIAGIRDVPRADRDQKIVDAHLSVNLDEGTARFTDYRVERFLPSVTLEEAVVFYSFPVTFVTRENGRTETQYVDDPEARNPEGHHFNGSPNFRMRPAMELKPNVIFRIGHQDGSFTLTELTWDQAVSRKDAQGQ